MKVLLLNVLTLVVLIQEVVGLMQDLSFYYDDHVIRWPGHKPWVYNLNRKNFTTPINFTFWLESNDMSTAEHMGTHIDAPAHLYKGAKRLDEIPLEDLIAPMVVIDVQEQSKQDRDYMLTIEDVMNHEKKHGQIPEGAAFFMYSGWDKFWFAHDRDAYLGTDSDDVWSLHHSGFHPDTAEWLLTNRKIKGVGIDCVSFDTGRSQEFGVHTTLFAQNVWGLENVANLGKVPATGATVYVFPMNIYQASGAPSRVVAFWGDGHSGKIHSAASSSDRSLSLFVMVAALLAILRLRLR